MFTAFSVILDLVIDVFFYSLFKSLMLLSVIQVISTAANLFSFILLSPFLDLLGHVKGYIVSSFIDIFSMTILTLTLAFSSNRVEVLFVLVLVSLFIGSLGASLYSLALETVIPIMFVKEELLKVNAVVRVMRLLLAIIALLIGGLLVEYLRYSRTFATLGLLAILQSIPLVLIYLAFRNNVKHGTPNSESSLSRLTIIEGLRFLKSNVSILKFTIYGSIFTLVLTPLMNLYPVAIAWTIIGPSALHVALLYVTIYISMVVGHTIAGWIGSSLRPARSIATITTSCSFLALVIAFSIYVRGNLMATIIAISAYIVMAVATGLVTILSSYVYQVWIPSDVRARVFGIRFSILTIASTFGTLVGGALADMLGLALAIVLLLIPLLTFGLTMLTDPKVRELDEY